MREVAEDVCVVGYGALLPGARNAESFWKNIASSSCSIRPLPNSRWNPAKYEGDGSERPCTNLAGYIDDHVIAEISRDLGINLEEYSRLHVIALAAATQALQHSGYLQAKIDRAGIFLGCMDADESTSKLRFAQDLLGAGAASDSQFEPDFRGWRREPQQVLSTCLTSSVLASLRDGLKLEARSLLVDAACASSLAAIELTVRALQEHRIDFGLTGGIESNLGPDRFVLFSKLGVLSTTRCRPFHRQSEGLNQGEGAVVFALERESDARRQAHPVLGVIKGCGTSGDGSGAGLFEPTSAGQVKALRNAYLTVDPADVDYVECHGTGTRKGDETELASIRTFFGDRRLPVGSVKALIGHTQAAAGAAGLLKCLLMIKHAVLPPNDYAAGIDRQPSGPYVNTDSSLIDVSKKPLTLGVSAFGFGGVNYHLVLQQATTCPVARTEGMSLSPQRSVVVVSSGHRASGIPLTDSEKISLRIPSNSLQQIDSVQTDAIVLVHETARRSFINLNSFPSEQVRVVSGSSTSLEAYFGLSNRVRCSESPYTRAAKHRFPAITEDSGPGVLNSVIAGRLANHFNFQGGSFNVDADTASPAAALWISELLLQKQDGLIIVVGVEASYRALPGRLVQSGISCWFLATRDFARKHKLPILNIVETKQPAAMELYANC